MERAWEGSPVQNFWSSYLKPIFWNPNSCRCHIQNRRTKSSTKNPTHFLSHIYIYIFSKPWDRSLWSLCRRSNPKQLISTPLTKKWRPASRRTGRREGMSVLAMDVSASTGSTQEVVVMLEVCTTTGFYSTSTILVTLAKSVCVTSTSSATSSTVRSWTSTSSGPWSLRMLRTRQPRILCRWSMSLSSGTSKFLGRGFCLRSNQSLSRPSLFPRLPRRRLKRLVGLLCLLLRWGFLRFWAVLDFVKFKRLVILLDRLILWILYVFLINLLVLAYLWLCLLHSWPGRIELIVWWC